MIMAKHTTGKKKTESVEETLCSFNGFLCDIVISVYMCAVLVVLPLYNKGYAQIGTEKENFFRKTMTYGGKALLPVFVLWAIFSSHYGDPCKEAAGDQGIAGEIVEGPEQYG